MPAHDRQIDPSRAVPRPLLSQRLRALGLVIVCGALLAGVLWGTNAVLGARASDTVRTRAELQLALMRGSIVTELQRNAVVPLLLSQDPALRDALATGNAALSMQRLTVLLDEVGSGGFLLLDARGRAVAATDAAVLGTDHATFPYFTNALAGPETVFTSFRNDTTGDMVFAYSRRVEVPGQVDGVVVVEVDLARFERSWRSPLGEVMVTDGRGQVLLATRADWRGQPEAGIVQPADDAGALWRLLEAVTGLRSGAPDGLLGDVAVLRSEVRVGFLGWRIAALTPYATVRERVNPFLVGEFAALAVVVSGGLYIVWRRARRLSAQLQRDTDKLRALNDQLNREVAQRRRAEESLQVAQQTIEQSSKLAALGEMSAAVSHDLNQPLAAMRTYLAGARLLVQRDRPEEALTSFRRIDDLIERMGAITGQMKTYARRGGDAVRGIDLRDVVTASLSMMEPQLRTRTIEVFSTLPERPVMVMADPMRLEQVLVNLFRNAIDAVRDVEGPRVDIVLGIGETATLSVRDNGHGIADLDALFEPFYTTKPPGDGVGLGLAIAAGIVAEAGGTLTARNGAAGGAVFMMQLPLQGRPPLPGTQTAQGMFADAVSVTAARA